MRRLSKNFGDFIFRRDRKVISATTTIRPAGYYPAVGFGDDVPAAVR